MEVEVATGDENKGFDRDLAEDNFSSGPDSD